MPHLVLIDGPNYVFRAFHAVKHNLSNSKGEPTNAIFGYVQMLRSILDRLTPTHVAVVFDPKGGTFRNTLYADYKAHRPPMPEELAVQWPRVFEVTDAFRLPRICVENYEADDVIATLAGQAERRGWDVTIVSTDKDLMQLISDRVWMLDTMRNKEYGSEEVKEKWGVGPEGIHELLALAGDSADNIPGIPGIGPKTAVQLLKDWGSLEGILENAPSIKQVKRRENIISHRDNARLSYQLVALVKDVTLPLTLDDLAIKMPNRPALFALFQQLEFRRLMAEFADVAPTEQAVSSSAEMTNAKTLSPARIDHCVSNNVALAALCQTLGQAPLIALDTETTSLQIHDADVVGLSFAVGQGEAWYIPIAHIASEGDAPVQLPQKIVWDALRPILEDASIEKCGQNLKFDRQVLRRAGINLAGVVADSMLLAYCLQAGKYPPSLDRLAEDFLDYHCTSFETVAGKGRNQRCFNTVALDVATPYACEDAEVAWRLTATLRNALNTRTIRHDTIELPLSHVLADMEWHGVSLDGGYLKQLSTRFGERIAILETAIHEAVGEVFNIQSPKQLGVILFEKLALPGGKKTKTGQWSTTHAVLAELSLIHDVPRLVVESRSLSKLKSTYTDALCGLIHHDTGRVHTSYNQAITTTGRLSSSEPNLQNIPIRSEEGREIRKAFIAPTGSLLLAADYSQIELRLMAHFSGDPAMIAAFHDGQDIHRTTAANIHGLAPEDVTGEMRRQAKAVNFGILYGMSAFGLAKQLAVTRKEAQAFIDAYFARYPQVCVFMEKTLVQARAQEWVETLCGHRVLVPEINSKNAMQRNYAERTAINAPLQGSAADIIKLAMNTLHQALAKAHPDAHLILQVHDELIVECPESCVDAVADLMRTCMESVVDLRVPLTVDIGWGVNWFEAHRL
ncbi:MAG: DNA polymerase I [Mariprofundaceae bacterium]|nr:DNA polymerase I [Mariprofundaceae bacterium]